MKKYLIYKIINKTNNMIYIGCHVTENINDRYMGSGTLIRKALKEYGLENFDKQILYIFDNELEMLKKEEELVNREFISDKNNYNVIVGGRNFLTIDTIPVIDKDGNYFRVNKNDERYLNGELVSIIKDKVIIKDKYGNSFFVNKNDERYLSGELVPIWTNKKHTEETKRKIGEKNSIKQKGEKNSQYGTCWVTKDNENKKIKKDELDIYLIDGWLKGRKLKQRMHE